MFSDAARQGAGRNIAAFHNAKRGARVAADFGGYAAWGIYQLKMQAGQGVSGDFWELVWER